MVVWASEAENRESVHVESSRDSVVNQLFVYKRSPFLIRLFRNYQNRFTFSLCEETENPYSLNGCQTALGRIEGYTIEDLTQMTQQEGGLVLSHPKATIHLKASDKDADLISVIYAPPTAVEGGSGDGSENQTSSEDRGAELSRSEISEYGRGKVGLIRFDEILTGEVLEVVKQDSRIRLRMCGANGCAEVGSSSGYLQEEILPPRKVYAQKGYEFQDGSRRTISFFRERKKSVRVYYCQDGDQDCQEIGVQGGYREKDLFEQRDFGTLKVHSKYSPPKLILFKRKKGAESVQYCDAGAVHLRRFVMRKCFAVEDSDPQLISSIHQRLERERRIDLPLAGYRLRFLRFERIEATQSVRASIHTCKNMADFMVRKGCEVIYESSLVKLGDFKKIKKIDLTPSKMIDEYIKVAIVEQTGVVTYKICQRWDETEICEFLGSPKGYLLSTILNIPKEGWITAAAKMGFSTAGTGLLTWMTVRSVAKRFVRIAQKAAGWFGTAYTFVLLPLTAWSIGETVWTGYNSISTGVAASYLKPPKHFDGQGVRKSLTIMEMQGYLLKALNVRKDSTGSIYYVSQDGPK